MGAKEEQWRLNQQIMQEEYRLYLLEHQITCPKGHSEKFEVHSEVSYNLGTMKIVDNMGRIVPGTDPHVNSTSYKCCTCKIFFTVKYKEGKIYRG